MPFSKLGLSDHVLRGVRAAGYENPTEIQSQAIPHVLAGRDLIGRAQTGSGKTAAFVLPMLDRLAAGRPMRGVARALVLTPTRELAVQIETAAATYGRGMRLRSTAVYGGVSILPQLNRLAGGIDVLVATPGRLLDHLDRRSVDLSHCEILVVDEADRMFDMGFINDVRKIIGHIPQLRQTMLFSATMSPEVRKLTAGIMNDPVTVEVGTDQRPADTVAQRFVAVQKDKKLSLLVHMLGQSDMSSVLVFSRTKHGADKIVKHLDRADVRAAVIHSNRSQGQRQAALEGFRRGSARVLVATDIAARGIDVRGVSHVINFDTPMFAEDYIHRIGRTGRAEATGEAITFISTDEYGALRKIEGHIGRRFRVERPEGFERDGVALQLTSVSQETDAPARGQTRRSDMSTEGPRRGTHSDGGRRSGPAQAPTTRETGDRRGGAQPWKSGSASSNARPRDDRQTPQGSWSRTDRRAPQDSWSRDEHSGHRKTLTEIGRSAHHTSAPADTRRSDTGTPARNGGFKSGGKTGGTGRGYSSGSRRPR